MTMAQNELTDMFRQIDLHTNRALDGVALMRARPEARILPEGKAIQRMGTMLVFALVAVSALIVF